MIELRTRDTLGHANHGWLDARHHFSFGEYRDPARASWGALRVWNDDVIAAETGFPPHPHANMEIITYVKEGAITHEDSLGNHGRTEAGDVQVMSAGSGIRHAEFNAEPVPTKLFQIWIMPTERGGAPSWGTRPFPKTDGAGGFVTLASGMAGDGNALPIRANGRVLGATLKAGQTETYQLTAARRAYLVPAAGRVTVNGTPVGTGDGVAVADEDTLTITALEDAEIVMVDVA